MTKREAAIVACYTDCMIGDIDELYKYLGEIAGTPVYTHDIPEAFEKYQEEIRKDFVNIKVVD